MTPGTSPRSLRAHAGTRTEKARSLRVGGLRLDVCVCGLSAWHNCAERASRDEVEVDLFVHKRLRSIRGCEDLRCADRECVIFRMALRFVAAKLFVVLSVAVRLPQRRPLLFAICTADSVACSSGLFRRARFRFAPFASARKHAIVSMLTAKSTVASSSRISRRDAPFSRSSKMPSPSGISFA